MIEITTVGKMSEEAIFPFSANSSSNNRGSASLSNHTLAMLQDEMLHNVLPTLYVIIFLVSTPMNVTSLWIFCRMPSKTSTMLFMINLAANDLAYGLTLPYLAVYHFRGNNWPFGNAFCSTTMILFYANMYCSILTMMCISVERYVGIVHPLRFQHFMNTRKASITCFLIWVLVLSINFPLLYAKLTFYVHELDITTCFDILPKEFASSLLIYFYTGCSFLVFFLIPTVVMIICYISIIVTLLRSSKKSGKSRKQTIYTIAALLLVLLVCFVPSNIILIAHAFPIGKQYHLYVAYKLSLPLSGFNCCLDPAVYYFGSKDFRQNVKGKISFLLHINTICENNKSQTTGDDITLS